MRTHLEVALVVSLLILSGCDAGTTAQSYNDPYEITRPSTVFAAQQEYYQQMQSMPRTQYVIRPNGNMNIYMPLPNGMFYQVD